MKYRYFVTDVDGTLTDGRIYMGRNGELIKAFNVKDGYGLRDILMKEHHVNVIVITGRSSPIVESRCSELGIQFLFQGVKDKVEKVQSIIDVDSFSSTVYVGDDLNDLPVMNFIKERGGFVACPRDSSMQVQRISDYISLRDGGDGAVRDIIDFIWG